jgi:hypothetical protein
MKKLILTVVAISFGISVFAQATITFNNSVAGYISTRIYAPFPGNPYLSRIGNGSTDFPAGTTDWTGFTKIGANGVNGQYGGATTFAQLLGAAGYNVPESGLLPGSTVTTFRTGTASGVVVNPASAGSEYTFNNIPPAAAQSTLEMVAWDNSSGLYPSWTQASLAWHAGLIAAGTSGTWNEDYLGGGIIAPLYMVNNTDSTQSARSFNLYFVPEPTTMALVGLGAAALLIFWHRK